MSMEKNLKKIIDELVQEVEKELEESTATGDVAGYNTPKAFSRKSDKERRKKNATQLGYKLVDNDVDNISEGKAKRPVNRWLELKNDESMHANKKLAVGLKELKYQLAEVEKFFSWYNKIKNINELDSSDYWKRTTGHIYKIKERIINIARTLQEIEK
jgi:hypothetical protein